MKPLRNQAIPTPGITWATRTPRGTFRLNRRSVCQKHQRKQSHRDIQTHHFTSHFPKLQQNQFVMDGDVEPYPAGMLAAWHRIFKLGRKVVVSKLSYLA
jgi:hypothetical protein